MKTTMLTAVFAVLCCGAVAEAQVYVQPANYNTYTVSQPLYAPANYGAPATYSAPATYNAPATYSTPVYSPATTYTPATTYYVGNACGQRVACTPCCNPCCNPCATTYVSASPCVPQAVYAPVTYAPAPAPAVACGPQIRRGLLGQPVVYVPGQPIRNALRFLSP